MEDSKVGLDDLKHFVVVPAPILDRFRSDLGTIGIKYQQPARKPTIKEFGVRSFHRYGTQAY
jgi:hypothetical protein